MALISRFLSLVLKGKLGYVVNGEGFPTWTEMFYTVQVSFQTGFGLDRFVLAREDLRNKGETSARLL